jgi:oligopeptide/dipeptide ABC transporter ATP-binding protein
LVGESGSGKTATAMSILGLLPPAARTLEGSVELEGRELLSLSGEEMRRLRGEKIALVPQNPLAALNPVLTIGWQLWEAIKSHDDTAVEETARERIIAALSSTGIAEPEQQLRRYPHEFSGGTRQRILIAMAIVNNPALLLADEPTTALDTTTQAQILEVMRKLIGERNMGMLLITHDMGVVANIADRVAVMYAGEIVEAGSADEIFEEPLHPYTEMLWTASPGWRGPRARRERPETSPREPRVQGECSFRSRCPVARQECRVHPALTAIDNRPGRMARCWVAQAEAHASLTEGSR